MRCRVTSLAKGVQEGLSPPDAKRIGSYQALFVPLAPISRACVFGF
jgi:hypothetical protein